MKKLLLIAIWTGLLLSGFSDETTHVYLIGNSLTMSLTLDRVHKLFEQRGIDFQFGSQVSGGKSLIRHLHYKDEPNQNWKSWETNKPEGDSFEPDTNMYLDTYPERFGLYDTALKNHQWDKVVFQIYGGNLGEDVEAISAFIDICLENKTCEHFYVYCPWPTRPKKMEDKKRIGLNIDYPVFWQAEYTYEVNSTDWRAKKAAPSRDYSHRLLDMLNEKYSSLKTPIRLIPTGEVLFALDEKIKAGALPGIKELAKRDPSMVPGLDHDTGFEHGVNVLYADPVHLNPVPHQENTLGIFVSGSTMFAALSEQSPVGLSGKVYGLDDKTDAKLIEAVQETIWDVITSEPRTGITK